MGVEHGGFCHDCKTYVDAHKCYAAADMLRPIKETPTHSDFEYWGKSIGYWGARLLWFVLKHAKHKTQIVTDCESEYFDLCGRYTEEVPYEEMQKQAERMKEA